MCVCLSQKLFRATIGVAVGCGVLHPKMLLLPTSLTLCCEGEWQPVRRPFGRFMIAFRATNRSCLSPFEKFSTRTWKINKLSEKPPQQTE